MKCIRHIEEIPFEKKSAITIGTFDGIHLAHQKIIGEVVAQAKEMHGRSVVVTFEPHPREVVPLMREEVMLLTTLQERQELCEHMGVDWFIVLKFDTAFSQQSFRDFYVTYLINGVGVDVVVEGYDHHWGRNREGNIETLIQLGNEFGFTVVNVDPFKYKNSPVNSSLIRKELLEGSVTVAAELLGRPYQVQGKVVLGSQRGRLLGFPTANVELNSKKKIVPKDGIYFARVTHEKEMYFGMVSIGVRPTFQTNRQRTIEVNILDYEKEIYGNTLRIEFLERLRDEVKYDTAEQLVQQMHIDKELSKKLRIEYQRRV